MLEIVAMTMLAAPAVEDPAIRTAILDAARKPASEALGKIVLFKVQALRKSGDWAFLLADMEEGDGRPLSYAGTPRAEAAANGMASRSYAALLKQRGESWTVVDSAVGPTDAPWEGWPRAHGAPEGLFRP